MLYGESLIDGVVDEQTVVGMVFKGDHLQDLLRYDGADDTGGRVELQLEHLVKLREQRLKLALDRTTLEPIVTFRAKQRLKLWQNIFHVH